MGFVIVVNLVRCRSEGLFLRWMHPATPLHLSYGKNFGAVPGYTPSHDCCVHMALLEDSEDVWQNNMRLFS